MTFSFSYPPPNEPPVPPSAPQPPPADPKRPLFGKIFAWVAIAFGVIFVLGGLLELPAFGFLVLGLVCLAAGVLYLFATSNGRRKFWIAPAIAILPALVVAGLTAPPSDEQEESTSGKTALSSAVASTATEESTISASPSTTSSTAAPLPTTTLPPVPSAAQDPITPTQAPMYVPPPAATTEPEAVPRAPAYTAPAPVYVPPPAADVPSSVYYRSCAAARAAGAAPLYAGNPGYSSALDRDGDGVACEK